MHNQYFLSVLTFKHHFYTLCRFRLDCVVTDKIDVTNFLMVGKVAENFFGSSAHHYVYDRGFNDLSIIAPPMA